MKLIMENWRSFLKEDSTPLVVIYFGGFKPPHKGHLAVVEEYLSMPEVERVYILFGTSPRHSADRSLYLDETHSQAVWHLFLDSLSSDKVTVLPPTSGNTMVAAAELAWLPELSGKRITAGYGAKEPKYGQSFIRVVESLAEEKGQPLAIPVATPSSIDVPGVSSTKIREALVQKDMKYLEQAVPAGVSVEEYINILT